MNDASYNSNALLMAHVTETMPLLHQRLQVQLLRLWALGFISSRLMLALLEMLLLQTTHLVFG